MALVALLLAGSAACARPEVSLEDPDGLVRVSQQAGADGARTLSVLPARAGLTLNAKAPPRFRGADGQELLLTGAVDASGEKFTGAVAGRIPAGRGVLRVSVCDSVVGICRATEVVLGT